MKIAFDHQIFTMQRYGGISRYFSRLAKEFIYMGDNPRIMAAFHRNYYLNDLPQSNVIGTQLKWFPPKTNRFFAAFNRFSCGRNVKKFEPSVYHETYYSSSPVEISGAARILTVYDMIHERFKESFSGRDKTSLNKRAAVDRADHIISISHSTKRDLCEQFDVAPDKVSVVHLGFEMFPSSSMENLFINSIRPFLLFVGNRRGYKNFAGMLRAVASRRELSSEFDIVAFGGGSFDGFDASLIQSLDLRPNSVLQVSGSDELLGAYYRRAAAFVYPSRYEGFGLPPLEAMAHGCPVITSNTSSMPEVVGQAGEFFSPDDIDEQAQAICNVVFDATRSDDLVLLGKERLENFSWRTCAKETRVVYQGV